MFSSSPIIAGLDIGTSKICAVIGELTEPGGLNIIGLGQARSRGVRKGEISHPAMAAEDIRNAIVEAEQTANAEVRSVYLGVTGSHIRGFNNRGIHPVPSDDREITEDDVQDAVRNAKAINLPSENRVVHLIRQHFLVDGQDEIQDPVGMCGARVEVDVHVVHGNFQRLQNPIRAVRGLQLDVEDIVFSGLASSLALLSNQQKEMGSLVIDLGSGCTEYVVYADGIIKHTGVLAVGGDHVSNDLAYGLKVPLKRAEQIKVEHGAALCDESCHGHTLKLSHEIGIAERTVNLEHLRRIMSLRLEEIFELIAEELNAAGMLTCLDAGIFLCGGGARIPGIERLAKQVFSMEVAMGSASGVGGVNSALNQPEFATAIGLVRYGSFQARKRHAEANSIGTQFKKTITQIFRR